MISSVFEVAMLIFGVCVVECGCLGIMEVGRGASRRKESEGRVE